ncbi:hypothetical protein HDA32_005698 [Spinactinospora alkalitolerans]|uniref:ABC transporter permease n=1 Tax=Spinactinospora alkalitolerans TaxID=687207 RepID=A0A852U2X3_9ACTN|nr:hypothetical protein [Spinactinospora alkalitolerans]NYE50578.1 hypothetical protein [Spinactinospora alkalitolerans]
MPGLWRLEWLRLFRAHRWIAIAAVYMVFGFTGPFLAKYAAELFAGTSPEAHVELPPPTPADGVEAYVDNGIGLSMLITVIIAAGTMAVDARRPLALFYRTRVRHPRDLVLPRYTVLTIGVISAYVAGATAAWYETAVLN